MTARTGTGAGLRRTLGFWVLLFYGLGMIVGAGIYVLVGEVAAAAGMSAPLAFLVAAALAALTGLSYAELCGRHPEAAGEVAYLEDAFASRILSTIVGCAIILVAVIAAASIARATGGYLRVYLDVPDWLPGAVLVAIFTTIASLGVRQGAVLAAILSVVELGGLAVILYFGGDALGSLPARVGELWPEDAVAWAGVGAGAFTAFFAFLGFENLVNMAEETREPEKTVPRALIAAIVLSGTIYAAVSLVAVLAVPPEKLAASDAPLCLIVERAGIDCRTSFSAIALIALANGVIVEIILVARLAYGMARRGLVPAWFGRVHRRSEVPVTATVMGGAVILVLASVVPLGPLVAATNAVTLFVFFMVNLALAVLHLRDRRQAIRPQRRPAVAAWIPITGAAACAGLFTIWLVGRL